MADSNQSDDDNLPLEALPAFLSGGRDVTVSALRERIEMQLLEETAPRPTILLESDDAARRQMIREALDYVLAVETLSITRPERLALTQLIYRDLFAFGPLADYFTDPNVTEITLDGPQRIHVRHGAADKMTVVKTTFDDAGHLERVLQCVLSTAGAWLSPDSPVLEVGTRVADRPVRLAVFGPPLSPVLHAELRVRPQRAFTLDNLIENDTLPAHAADLLRAILAAGHGLMVAGDMGAGKTSLLEALAPELPASAIVVERAAELRLPERMQRFTVIPPLPGQAAVEFPDQILAAVAERPSWLVLDEVRYDEAKAIWQALTDDSKPRCLWAFRSSTDPLRLRSAFSMAVRRAQQGIEQEFINSALTERLPYVAMLARRNEQIRLISIAEWQPDPAQPDTLMLKPQWPLA